MAFRMGGLFIKAQVENGAGTFSLGSNNSFVNSISSMSLVMRNGGSSSITVALSPTFPQAVEIIESGFLGFGFPVKSSNTQSEPSNLINGLTSRVSASGSGQGASSKAASLSVQLGYGDLNADESVSKLPWTTGIIQAPDLSFGEEIGIVIKAESFGTKLTSSDTTRVFEGTSLFDIINEIVVTDSNAKVEFTPQAEERAKKIKITRNQSDNSQAFIIDILNEHNFKYYESGGTAKDPSLVLKIDDLAGISNGSADFTVVLYGQIDIPNHVYPIETFETNINHTFVAGAFFGSKTTSIKTSDKEVEQNEFGLDSFKKDVKAAGKTISGKLEPGKPTKAGATDGPPDLKDKSRAGKRYMAVKKNSEDNDQSDSVKNKVNDAIAGSMVVTVSGPLITEAIPNRLVKLEVLTGNPDKPRFNTISGIYRIMTVTHSVNDGGGTTEMELYRGIGAGDLLSENVQQTSQASLPSGSEAVASLTSLVKGIFA